MPVIDIFHPRGTAPLGVLEMLCCEVTGLLDIPADNAFAFWHTIAKGNFHRPGWTPDAGYDAGPVVRIRCKSTYSDTQVDALIRLVSDTLATTLGCPKDSPFVLLDRVLPGQLMARGDVWAPEMATASVVLTPVGYVRNDRDAVVDDFWGDVVSQIELDTAVVPSHSLEGLERFSHAEVVFHFDRVAGKPLNLELRAPRGLAHLPRIGVFSQRVKDRPNWLGVSRCEVLERNGTTLTVRGLDAINGTPVLDIKPWMTDFAPRQLTEEPSWVSEIMSDYYSVEYQSTPFARRTETLGLWAGVAASFGLRWPAYTKEEAEIILRGVQM